MGTRSIQIFREFPIAASRNHFRRFIDDDNTNFTTRRWRIFADGRSGGSRWDWEGSSNPNRRSRFRDAYATDDLGEEDGFGFRNAAKQRVWWSDDFDDEDDDDEEDGFGILEASIGFEWVFKILQAFGWMIPAVAISLLMGTGPNSIIMALALPLAQSAFSLAADALWGRADGTPRTKTRRKRRPFAGSPGRSRARREREARNQKKEAGNYKSWFEGTKNSAKGSGNGQDFGGWDELDNTVRADRDPHVPPSKKEEKPEANEGFKICRRTKGDTPLVMRLLIAMFPFLGFWTKLF